MEVPEIKKDDLNQQSKDSVQSSDDGDHSVVEYKNKSPQLFEPPESLIKSQELMLKKPHRLPNLNHTLPKEISMIHHMANTPQQ